MCVKWSRHEAEVRRLHSQSRPTGHLRRRQTPGKQLQLLLQPPQRQQRQRRQRQQKDQITTSDATVRLGYKAKRRPVQARITSAVQPANQRPIYLYRGSRSGQSLDSLV